MKSSTRIIDLDPRIDFNRDTCGQCKAFKANVSVCKGKVEHVILGCEVVDTLNALGEQAEREMSIDQICSGVREKMILAKYPFSDKKLQKHQCQPLKDAAEFLVAEQRWEITRRAKDVCRKTKKPCGPAIDQSAGEDVHI